MALPKCGLYRTGVALPGREQAVGSNRLIYFHNHSKQGPPLVLLPEVNTFNRWRFAERGYLVQGDVAASFLTQLIPLPRQGFYAVTAPIDLADGKVLSKRSLVQVGYNARGEPIVFPAQFRGNGMWFPERGFRFDGLGIFERLTDAGFDPPAGEAVIETLH